MEMFDLNEILLKVIKYPTRWLLKSTSTPGDIAGELGVSKSKPIIYLLKTHSATDLIALEKTTERLGLPSPFQKLRIGKRELTTSLFIEKPKALFSNRKRVTDIEKVTANLFRLHREDDNLDIQIVPVSVFWGREPRQDNKTWIGTITGLNSPTWLRKLFIVLFLGRDNVVGFSRSVSSREMTNMLQSDSDEQLAHKLMRLARTHFFRRQQSITGPRPLHIAQLYNGVLGAEAVRRAIADTALNKKIPNEQVKEKARKYIQEIAADYSSSVIRIADRLLTKVWNKIYNGIDVRHAERVRELAQNGHEIIYAPCHRSHMDYLLLTYVIYHEGLMTPYIAAGINLNFWPVGGIFRRSGAFFIRRSFKGNTLYTAVFREYIEQLFARGYSVKYYVEGGRSRTGRVLPPKTGMLAMTVQALLKSSRRPITIVPVYIGYEHVMEVSTYLQELKGSKKEKESFFQIFSAVRNLKNYGHGFLNFGTPITLAQYLDDNVANWREDQANGNLAKKPSWLTPTVNRLGIDILERVNSAAAINGMSLASLCLLCAKKHTLAKEELIFAMQTLLDLQRIAPYSSDFSIPEGDAETLLQGTEKLGKFTITQDKFGSIFSLERRTAVALTYYRNNILHLFALPSLIAAIVIGKQGCNRQRLISLATRFYPMLKRELFMYMDTQQAETYLEKLLDSMLTLGLLADDNGTIVEPSPRQSHEATGDSKYTLWLLNRVVQETLQRYALVLSQLDTVQRISRANLEKHSQMIAERMSALHGISAPEFYDKNVLNTFIIALRDNGLIDEDDNGLLAAKPESKELQAEILTLVSPQFSQRVYQVKALQK